jgi:hypothetical protein
VGLRSIASITLRPMAKTLQFIGEAPFLLLIEAHIQRLGGFGERFLIGGPLTQKSRFLAHLLDHVEGPFKLRAFSSIG